MASDTTGGPAGTGGVLSLSQILNVFYRRRLLVLGLTLLGLVLGAAYGLVASERFSSTAQVRPGVVAYAADGSPLREWALEDVVRWFDNRLYWIEMQQQDEFAGGSSPVIRAEFIPSLNFVQGGNVITLTTFSEDPDRGALILDRAVDAFNRLAAEDTLGSTLHLTRRALRVQMDRVDRGIEQLKADEERTGLEIAQQERELEMLRLERQGIELDLAVLESRNRWHGEAAGAIRSEVAATEARLAQASELLSDLLAAEGGAQPSRPAGGDPVTEVLLQTAGREQAGRVGELLATVSSLEKAVAVGTVRADSLDAATRENELQMTRLRGVLEIELAKKEADVRQRIRDLEIHLTYDLPHDRALMVAERDGYRVKQELLSPLERVGRTTTSDGPVRPRKARAAGILAFLAFFGSLALALVLEYLSLNREAITGRRQS